MPFDMEIRMSLQNIRFNIMSLPVNYSFKTLLLGDIDLATYYYGIQEIQSVQGYLSMLIGRITSHIPPNTFPCDQYDLLLTDCYALLQALTASPLPAEPSNLPEPTGLQHSNIAPTPLTLEPAIPKSVDPGPDESKFGEPELREQVSFEQELTEPEPVEQVSVEQELTEAEPVEQVSVEQELTEAEPVIQASIEEEPVIREDTEDAMRPVNTPCPEKLCLRWNFPVSPSR